MPLEETVEDLSGRWFGRLRVIRREPDHHLCGCRRWRCECECGLVAPAVYEHSLLNGSVESCGCSVQVKRQRKSIEYAA